MRPVDQSIEPAREAAMMRLLRRVVRRALPRGRGGAMAAGLASLLVALATAPAAPAKDLIDTLSETRSVSTLLDLLRAAEMEDCLRRAGPYTLFAPTDEAFANLPPHIMTALVQPENRAQLVAMINRHLLASRLLARNQAGRRKLVITVEGSWLLIDGTGGVLMIDEGVEVLQADIAVDNGVIHIIDSVVLQDEPGGSLVPGAF